MYKIEIIRHGVNFLGATLDCGLGLFMLVMGLIFLMSVIKHFVDNGG